VCLSRDRGHVRCSQLGYCDFTQCYDRQKKELEAKGVAQADRLAKLSCKYPE